MKYALLLLLTGAMMWAAYEKGHLDGSSTAIRYAMDDWPPKQDEDTWVTVAGDKDKAHSHCYIEKASAFLA